MTESRGLYAALGKGESMYLKFWGVREDGEYSKSKHQPRPGWTYRGARRNVARLAHWPRRYRWRLFMRQLRERAQAMIAQRRAAPA